MKKLALTLTALCFGLISHIEAKSKDQRLCLTPCYTYQHVNAYKEIEGLCKTLCSICFTDEKHELCKTHTAKTTACADKLKGSTESIGKKGAAFLKCLKE